jgi:putative membrane protein
MLAPFLTAMLLIAPPAAPAAPATPATAKPADAKPANAKSGDAKPADATPAEAPAPPPSPERTPEAFLADVAAVDLLQLSLGRLAAERGVDPSVKEFGRRMVVNHTAVQVLVTRIAGRQRVSLPAQMTEEDRATYADIAGRSGVELDRAYLMYIAGRNARTLELFRWQAENGANAEVKSFAAQTAAIMGTHARVAESINQVVNKDELRRIAEEKAQALREEEQRKIIEAQEAAIAAAKRKGGKKPAPKKPMGATS